MGTEERISNDGVTEIDCTLETTPTIGVTGCFNTNNRLPRPARGGGRLNRAAGTCTAACGGTSSGGGGPKRRKGFAKGRSFGGLACWAWVLPWVLLVLGGMEGVKGVPIPDGDCGGGGDRNCAIKQAVDAYITSAATGSYGPIEDWNTSLVTDMSYLFAGKSTFNANISAWQVGKVTTMKWSTYHSLPAPSPRSGLFFCFLLFPFFPSKNTNSIFVQCSLLFFFHPHFLFLDFSLLLWCSVS
jgi:hypothetical protein